MGKGFYAMETREDPWVLPYGIPVASYRADPRVGVMEPRRHP
jgi:hypothetical protein